MIEGQQMLKDMKTQTFGVIRGDAELEERI
jgi:hypothetical protein